MDEHPEPTSDAFARAAQTLAVTISVVEALARLRAQRTHHQADATEHAASAVRATEALRYESARLRWTQALDDHTLRRLSASEMLQAWHAADTYRGVDPTATQAADHVERRLRAVHPEAMAAFDAALARGVSPTEAMQQGIEHFRGEFGFDAPGSRLYFSDSADALRHASAAGRQDNPGTVFVDEGTSSQQSARAYYAVAVEARALAELAMPVAIHEAMATAPQAAKRMLALPPAPAGRQSITRREAPTPAAANR